MRRSLNWALDLRLTVTSPSLGDHLSSAIREQIGIRNLNVEGQSTLYLEGADAGLLESIDVSGIFLPRAKMLRQLRADHARINGADVDYPNLISISGDIRGDDFFKACPNLEDLQLMPSQYTYLYAFPDWPRTFAPQTLTRIEITTYCYATEYLKTFRGCRSLQTVRLNTPCSTDSVLRMLVNAGSILHRLVINDQEAHLESDSPSGLQIYTQRDDSSLGISAFPTLRELTVSQWGNTFCRSDSISCPALERLTLHVTCSDLRSASHEIMIDAPALQTLVLHYVVDQRDLRRSKAFVRIVIKYLSWLLRRLGVSRLCALVITGPDFDATQIDEVTLATICEHAEHLYHDERELEMPRFRVMRV